MSSARTLDERIELIIRRTKENDATARKTRILEAYQLAASLHEGVMRKDGVTPYIDHPVAVAEIVANNGGDQRMVMAALLHDTVEDTPYTLQSLAVTFGREVAAIVDAVTQVEANIPDEITDNHQRRLIKNYVDGLSNAKLLDPNNPQAGKAIYIKLADRLHNMQTIGACSREARVRKASDTLKFFVPLAKVIGSKYFERELSELCFSVLQPELHSEISAAYEDTRSKNSHFISAFMKAFDFALRDAPRGKGRPFLKTGNASFKCYQIKELLGELNRPHGSLGGFSKSSIFLYEITLEYQGPASDNMLEAFTDIYFSELRRLDIRLEVLFDHLDENTVRICLMDRFSNRYLIVLQQTGASSAPSDYAALFPPENSIIEMPESFITVFSKDGQAYQMMEGSTVLDFAFRIHPDLGCSARYGLIRRGSGAFKLMSEPNLGEIAICSPDDVECEIDHPLQDGDYVYVVDAKDASGKPIYLAKYEWFNYVKTKYARDHLIEFFEKANPMNGHVNGAISWNPTASERYS